MSSSPSRSRAAAPLLTLAALALALLGAGCSEQEVVVVPVRRPDVVLVLIDTLRADRTTLLDPSLSTTPNLAAFGRRGTVFSQTVAPSSWTIPSMVALFTGAEITEHTEIMFEDLPSLPERFAAAGYITACVSSQPLIGKTTGLDRGFEQQDVIPLQDILSLVEHEEEVRGRWGAAALVDRARALLAGADPDRPVFLYVHLLDPHLPYDDRQAQRTPIRADWSVIPTDHPPQVYWTDTLPTDVAERLAQARRTYDGMISVADAGLAPLLAEGGTGRDRPTVLAVTADHGEGLLSHDDIGLPGRDVKFPNGYYIHGHQRYEEAVRVPLWLVGPGVPVGRRETRQVALRDVGATLLGLAGVSASGPVLPLSDDAPAATVVMGADRAGWFARTETRKLVVPSDHRVKRFDLAPRLFAVRDAEYLPETEDLAAQEPDLVSALLEGLETWKSETPGARENTDPDLEQQLRALGYVR